MSQNSYSNTYYTSLARLGTGTNPRNGVRVTTRESADEIGVSVEQPASKKAIRMEMVVPIRRSGRGSRRAARFTLNGRQARELYETLERFYSQRDNTNR